MFINIRSKAFTSEEGIAVNLSYKASQDPGSSEMLFY